MLLALLSALLSSVCHGGPIHWHSTAQLESGGNPRCSRSVTETVYDATWECYKADYWMTGHISHHDNHHEDRRFKWKYGRPRDSNADYSYSMYTEVLPTTDYDKTWTRSCSWRGSSSSAIYSINSWHSNNREDRQWKITCKNLPDQYFTSACTWTDYLNNWDSNLDYTCDGVIKGMGSYHDNYREDRRFKFQCCKIINTPMDLSPVYDDYRVVTGIVSEYEDGTRVTTTDSYGKPRWYKDGGNTVDSKYSLTKTRDASYYWVRVCPHNGAFTSITQGTSTFSFQCAKLINAVKMHDCAWTKYLNEFHRFFNGYCDKNGAIRGIQSYYSPASDDRKFKIYCCQFKRETYTSIYNDIRIKVKSGPGGYDKSNAIINFDLCWNNDKYQGIKILNKKNQWFTMNELVKYGSCGNERVLTVSTDSTDDVTITEIGVRDNYVDYIIKSFDVYESSTSQSTRKDTFSLDKNGVSIMDVIIKFPDDYLTACVTSNGGTGCVGALYNLDEYQHYLITITPCASFAIGSGTPTIGVVLRGTNGNLDKKILTGRKFEEVPAGQGNIGDLIHINIEYESGPDFCIEKVTLHDPYEGIEAFGEDYFGDGIILSNDCSNDGDFRRLSGIQYVPCYDTPFSITTYETLIYTSVQIHSCSGSGGGVSAANSGLLSLTITGISKNDKFVSSDALSLKTATSWNAGDSRDYTLRLSGDFDELTFITLTNNHQSDALCVDSVLINGVDAFLSHYWVGFTANHDSLPTIPAVLEWPICDIELTTTISAKSPLPVEPESVATSTCVNRNRLVYVDCEISQTFETYEEISWEQETGQEVTNDVTMEGGTSTSVSASFTYSGSVATEATVGSAKVTNTIEKSGTVGADRTWSSSMSVSNGVTTLDVTTDGKVNGDTIGVECSGSVSVPPSQQIAYAMLIDHSEATLTTLTDIKMTKCSAYLYGEDHYDPNDYIYTYGIEGQLTVKEATNCYVSFSQAEQVNPEGITCGEERALATREWGTYVPQCDEKDPTKYMKCQCSYGDSRTHPTCGCVDEETGNLLEVGKGAVVPETDNYKWPDWCAEHCGRKAEPAPQRRTRFRAASQPLEHDVVIDTISDSYSKENDFNVNVLGVIGIGIMLGVLTYMVNSCISCYKKCPCGSSVNKYQSVRLFDTDTEVEKEEL